MALDRRLFLVTAAGALASRAALHGRQSGLEAFGGDALPCVLDVKPTPAVSADGSYKPGAPTRTAIATIGLPGVPLELSGVVAGLSCGPIVGATVEFWQPDASGAYDSRGFNLRGRQLTVAGGRYRLTTIVPGASGNRAPSIGVHVVVERKAELWTAIFFPGQSTNARDPRFKEELVLTLGGTNQKRTGRFDIRLDL